MKPSILSTALFLLAFGMRSTAAAATAAPPPPEPVTVTIVATDPTAAEAGPSTGLFTVQRTGSTAASLTVVYLTSGTAVAPGDYAPLPGSLVIPAGSKSASILVTPVDDAIAEGDETVVVTLISPIQPLASGTPPVTSQLYSVGKPSSATVVIKDNDLGNATLPTVNIRATTPNATEPAQAGKITISRLGDITTALIVNYDIVKDPQTQGPATGTSPTVTGPIVVIPPATPGVDYQPLPGSVTIPPGAKSIAILIQPIDNPVVEGRQHVTLRLKPSPAFNINQPDTATVFINEAPPINIAPVVTLLTPVSGSKFTAPVDITLSAQASDKDGTVQKVDFLSGSKVIGTVSGPQANNTYSFVWKNVAGGTYELRARATDDKGASTVSSPAAISVSASVNQPPTVTILTPQAGATFTAPAAITILAQANDPDGVVRTVEFFANDKSLGVITANPASASPVNPFQLTWKVTAPGSYALTAKATDNQGGTATSAPVKITVTGSINQAPKVALTSPKDQDVLDLGTTIKLAAEAADSDGTIVAVDFYANDHLIGSAKTAPYTVNWEHALAGQYVLLAKATDNGGATAVSAPVHVTVRQKPASPATLVINTPADGATFQAPADVAINATAVDPKSYISRVEFYANDVLLGVSELMFFRAPNPGTPIQHMFVWNAVPAGIYTLTVKAKDSTGASVASAPVKITVLPILIGSPVKPQIVGGAHRVVFQGDPGQSYSIQVSSNLVDWTQVGTVMNTEGTFEYLDSAPDATPVRFYRAVPKPQE